MIFIHIYWEESVKEETSKWGEWSQWTTCDKKCGGGQRSRERVCITTSSYDAARCEGGAVQREACNEEVCEKGKLIYLCEKLIIHHLIKRRLKLMNEKLSNILSYFHVRFKFCKFELICYVICQVDKVTWKNVFVPR